MRWNGLPIPAVMTAGAIVATLATAPLPAMAQTVTAEREVPFVTLRNRTDAEEPGELFGDERSTPSAGWCKVRALDVGPLTSLAEAAPSFIREDLLRVDRVREADTDAVLGALRDGAAGRSPVLYVHGYYISFEKGCRRAVLLQENAGLDGRFLWFSWPSDGAALNYTHDEADLYWSVPDLADTILELESRFDGQPVNIVGHSLGARGVVLALYDVANRKPDARIGEVVLLAPDMDFDIFVRFLPRIAPIVGQITIYVAPGDRPLAISAQLHGYPRLGEAGNDVAQLDGVEVIDLGDLPTDSPTGHLYHIYSKTVGADLDQLLNGGLHAAERSALRPDGPNLWRFRQPAD